MNEKPQLGSDHSAFQNHGDVARKFEFSGVFFWTTKVTVSKRRVVIKTKWRRWNVPLADIRYIYLTKYPRIPKYGPPEMWPVDGPTHCVITYGRDQDKPKIIKFMVRKQSLLFDEFIRYILNLNPSMNLLDLPPSQAFRKMKITDPFFTSALRFCILFFAVCLLALLPHAIHGLDPRHKAVYPSQTSSLRVFETRNVSVHAKRLDWYEALRNQDAICLESPLVDETAGPNDPVSLVALIDCPSNRQQNFKAEPTVYRGMIRDILWEGLPQSTRKAMEQKGIKFAGKVKLLDLYARPEGERTYLIYLGIISIGVIFGFFRAILVRRQQG